MSIQFTKAFVSNGLTFATLEEAQIAELDALFSANATSPASTTIMQNVDKVLDILSTTESSRPAARRVNGGTKKRKPKTDAPAATQPELKSV